MKCSVFIATSLDGFIARTNGDLDWLPGSDGAAGDEDFGFGEFFASIDTLVMGRKTYELALTFNPWPYHGKRVVVLSSRFPKGLAPLGDGGVHGTSLPPGDLVRELASSGAAHVYVDGGKTIQSFLRGGLINELTITRIPILLGDGIALFGPLPHDLRLTHLTTKAFANGFVQSRYALTHAA